MSWWQRWFKPKTPKSPLDGWHKQSTKEGFNGDIFTDHDSILMVSHTNSLHDGTVDTWKDNRVEIGKEIPKRPQNWYLDVKFHKLPNIDSWVIFSQLWNRTHDNVCSLSLRHKDGSIEVFLNKKQNKKTTGLWKGKFNIDTELSVRLKVSANSVTGTINGENVGKHSLELFTREKQHIKHGMYWSEKIPFDKKSEMILEYNLS